MTYIICIKTISLSLEVDDFRRNKEMSHHFTYSSIRFKHIVHVIDIIRD